MPAVVTSGTGIDGEHFQAIVVLHFANVRMSRDEKFWWETLEVTTHFGSIFAWIAANMSKKDINLFAFKAFVCAKFGAGELVVDVASNGYEGFYGA